MATSTVHRIREKVVHMPVLHTVAATFPVQAALQLLPLSGDGQFNGLAGVAVERSSGHVFVADTGNTRIEEFTNTGTFVTQWGCRGSGVGQFNSLGGVAADGSGHVFVADVGNNRIQKFACP